MRRCTQSVTVCNVHWHASICESDLGKCFIPPVRGIFGDFNDGRRLKPTQDCAQRQNGLCAGHTVYLL
jgi:hypothetical protein